MQSGTAADVGAAISKLFGIPDSIINSVVRRLGEAGLILRAGRGQNLPYLESIHCARLLLGVMSIADGFFGATVRVDLAVRKLEKLRAVKSDESAPIGRLDSFTAQVALLIEQAARGDAEIKCISAIGLSFEGDRTWGWVEISASPHIGRVRFPRRIDYTSGKTRQEGGVVQQMRVDVRSLEELAVIWRRAGLNE